MLETDILINQLVVHKSFGKGIIRSANEKYLEVDFTEKGKVSKFPYPSCFYGYLSLENSKLQAEIDAVVEVWKQESGATRKEELMHQYERNMQDIEARRAATKEKKLKAAWEMEHRFTYSNVR